jgi:hypothetical protein
MLHEPGVARKLIEAERLSFDCKYHERSCRSRLSRDRHAHDQQQGCLQLDDSDCPGSLAQPYVEKKPSRGTSSMLSVTFDEIGSVPVRFQVVRSENIWSYELVPVRVEAPSCTGAVCRDLANEMHSPSA